MTRLVAPFFAFLAALALFGSLAALLFLPGALAEFELEPEDAYLLVFWAVLLSLLGLFWVSVAVRCYCRSAGGLGLRGRVVATLVALAGGLIAGIGLFDPLDAPLLVGLGLLCAGSAGVFV